MDPVIAEQIIVRGDLIVTRESANKIMTRSRAKTTPEQYARIPFAQRVLQILLNEYQNCQEGPDVADALLSADNSFDADDDEDEDEDGGWEETGEMAYLSDLIDREDVATDTGDDDDEFEANLMAGVWMSDPMMQCSIGESIKSILKSVVPRIGACAGNLQPTQQELLRAVLQ